jgi:hypothetical protein
MFKDPVSAIKQSVLVCDQPDWKDPDGECRLKSDNDIFLKVALPSSISGVV